METKSYTGGRPLSVVTFENSLQDRAMGGYMRISVTHSVRVGLEYFQTHFLLDLSSCSMNETKVRNKERSKNDSNHSLNRIDDVNIRNEERTKNNNIHNAARIDDYVIESSTESTSFFIFIGMVSIVVFMTIGGLAFMCKTSREFQCCCKCKNLDKTDGTLSSIVLSLNQLSKQEQAFKLKEATGGQRRMETDENLIYGDYYTDGGRMATEMEVTFEFSFPKNCIVQGIVLLEFWAGTEKWKLDCSILMFQAEDTNPYYDSVYMESNMDTRVKDNNPVYGNN